MVMYILVTFTVALLAADLSSVLTQGWRKESVETLRFVLGILGFQGATLAWAYWLLRVNRAGATEAFGLGTLGLKSVVKFAVGAGLAITAVALGLGKVSETVMAYLGFQAEPQTVVQILEATHSLPKQALYGFMAVVVAPVAEEVLFRGILYPTIKQLGLPRLALWGTAILFGLIHLNWMALVPLTVVALLLTWLYERTGDLLAPIGAHCVFNLVNFSLLLAIPRPGQ